MTNGKESTQIEIIALDFYDGATEGFSLSVANLGPAYFKLIAWDEHQDQRLFVVVSIAKLIFDTIFDLLVKANDKPSSINWLPNWSFVNGQDEAEANKIVESCQKELISKGVLIKGSKVSSESMCIYKINDSLLASVERAMREPEDLDSWLVKLESEIDGPSYKL